MLLDMYMPRCELITDILGVVVKLRFVEMFVTPHLDVRFLEFPNLVNLRGARPLIV